jgi:drug/metabolite transporter (DMT)-like permease|tara:strand:+ start:19012 stop:19917 length:906 start_codon:yes stop_codon:yes gene_type:complete
MTGNFKSTQLFLVVLVTLAWAACFPLIELGHRAAPPLRFAAIRSLIAGASIVIPLLIYRRDWLSDWNIWKYSLIVALTYTVMGFGGMFLADGRVSPGIATVLANTQPLIAATLGFFILGERLTGRNLFGLFVSLLGIVVIAQESLSALTIDDGVLGITFILFGAFGTGAGNVFMKKSANKCDPIALTGLQFLIGFIILYPISHVFEFHLPIDWHPSFFWSLMILAIPGTSLATILWLHLLKKVRLNTLNVFTFLTPAFGLGIGFLFFEERYSFLDLSGVALTLFGIYLATTAPGKVTEVIE